MENSFKIVFKGLDASRAVEAEVRAWLGKLAPLTTAAGITGGQITIEAVHQHNQGSRHHARMDLSIPGRALVIGPEHPGNAAHEDVYVAVRNVFRALRRQLEADRERRREQRVEVQDGWAGGRVTFVDPVLKFGWLANGEGREIYFHGDSVSGGIERLALGGEVHFREESGADGPEARAVKPLPDAALSPRP
jgi:cold shock CspA family protein/ribosome-associated translation inhibitor RaiA